MFCEDLLSDGEISVFAIFKNHNGYVTVIHVYSLLLTIISLFC